MRCGAGPFDGNRRNCYRLIHASQILGKGEIRRLCIDGAGKALTEVPRAPWVEIYYRKTLACTGSPQNICVVNLTKGRPRRPWPVPLLVMKPSINRPGRYVDVDDWVLRAVVPFLQEKK